MTAKNNKARVGQQRKLKSPHFFMRLLSSRHIFIGVLVCLTLGINAVVAYFNIGQLVRGNRQLLETVSVVSELENVAGLVKDAESAQRSFILTGNATYIDAFADSRRELSGSLNNLSQAATDSQQQAQIPILKSAVASRLEIAGRGISLRQTKGMAAATDWLETGAAERENRRIENIITEMRARENDLLDARSTQAGEAADDATRTFWIETLVAFLFLGLISFLLGRAARQNRELERAYREIQRAESMRDNLTAMLVHDLRTPLTGLLAPLQMLEAEMLGPLDESQREVVQISNRSGQRLLGMVNALLDVSKMEAGEFAIHRQTVEIEPLLTRVIQIARPMEDSDSAQIVARCEQKTVEADPDLLERILINLVGNALKFTPRDGQITLSAEPTPNKTHFAVSDNGPGIAPEFQDKIFDKFGQVENRQKGAKFSTGLGLTFCKLAVEAHGGTIGVISEVGVGSEFWFEI